MRLQEKILLSLSKKPGSNEYKRSEDWNRENALSLLCRCFPGFMNEIAGKEILDYGCGGGYQSTALALNGAKYVLGIDIRETALQVARSVAREAGVDNRIKFCDKLNNRFRNRFDMVISQNSMEHYTDPILALTHMKSALRQDGRLLITFGPPWFAPYGGHTYFFCKVPWLNIIFDEKTVMSVRSHFRNDGASRYEEVNGGLNKMSVSKFEHLISESGMVFMYRKYECVKRINFLSKFPMVRELFINHISCILTKR